MEWESIVSIYPFVKALAKKLPGLRESIEKPGGEENPMLELQLEVISRIMDLQRSSEISSFITAKISNPDSDIGQVLKARKWALDVYKTIHMDE